MWISPPGSDFRFLCADCFYKIFFFFVFSFPFKNLWINVNLVSQCSLGRFPFTGALINSINVKSLTSVSKSWIWEIICLYLLRTSSVQQSVMEAAEDVTKQHQGRYFKDVSPHQAIHTVDYNKSSRFLASWYKTSWGIMCLCVMWKICVYMYFYIHILLHRALILLVLYTVMMSDGREKMWQQLIRIRFTAK